MSECNHDCGSCSANCDSRKADKSEFLEALNPASSVKKVIGVVSGKGGVGKSLVTSMLAVSMNRKGKKTAVLDADITGPSIPMAFGIGNEGVATSPDGKLMLPAKSMEGVEVMSANLLLDKDTDPVIWRGPVIAGAVKQFWSETLWQDVDYMFVENMSYLECPDCGKRISVFGEGHVEEIAAEHGIKVLAQIPIDPAIAQMVDAGRVEYLEMPWFDEAVKAVEAL